MIEGIVREAIEVWAVTSELPGAEACGIRLIVELENPENELNLSIHGEECLPFFIWINHKHNDSNIDLAWLKKECMQIIESLFHVFGELRGGYREAKRLYDLIVSGIEGNDLITQYAEDMLQKLDPSKEPVLQNSVGHMLSQQQGSLMNVALVAGIQAFDCIESQLGASFAQSILQSEPLSTCPEEIKRAYTKALSAVVKQAFVRAVAAPFRKKRDMFRTSVFNALISQSASEAQHTTSLT